MRRHRYAVIVAFGIAAAACVPRWRRVVLGIVLGGAFSALHLRLLTHRIDGILRQTRTSALLVIAGPLAGLAVLATPLLCACALPRYLSWEGVLVGLLARKVMLFFEALRGGPVDGD